MATPADFFESVHCRSGANCKRCRNRVDDRPWRASIAKRFGIAGPDFDCPHGKPWNSHAAAVGDGSDFAGRISLCIAACNERAPSLALTLASAFQGANHGVGKTGRTWRVPDELVIVDDASTLLDRESIGDAVRPVRRFAPVVYEESYERLGTSAAKGRAACLSTGDVLVVADAHMIFPLEFWEHVASEVARHGEMAVLNPGSVGFEWGGGVIGGGKLTWSSDHGCWDSTWRATSDPVSSILGGCYVFPRAVYERIGGFSSAAYGYGSDEPDMSHRTWATGGRIVQIDGPPVRHNYNRPNWRGSTANWELAYNRFASALTNLSDKLLDEHTRPALARHPMRAAIEAKLAERSDAIAARREHLQRHRVITDDEIVRRFRLDAPWVSTGCGCGRASSAVEHQSKTY